MTVGSTHTKNPAAGWDISASAKADTGEKIAHAQILVKGLSEYDESFNPALSTWQAQLIQKGRYPADNLVQVTVTNDQGDDAESDDEWS